jgi:extracellular elastinolytic metalloproteinase
MFMSNSLTPWLYGCALWLAACATGGPDDGATITRDRDRALAAIQRQAGAPVTFEVGATGDARVLAMTPRFPVPGHASDPAVVASDFLAAHHDAFQLDAVDATQFTVTRVDIDRAGDIRHVTLNRVLDGIPVYQGALTVHMDGGNGVFRVLGDDSYHIAAPINRVMLSPREAAVAAGRALGVPLSPVLARSEDQHAVFTSAGTLAPIHVDPKIVHVAQGDDRFAYQATVAWRDEHDQQQYQLALIDAQDGSLLANHSLVNGFAGKVFATHGPGAHPSSDTREDVSFDGNPTASPQGWVGAARTTAGNNAVACTDLNADDSCAGGNEIQPVADANNRFDFAFVPRFLTGDRPADVVNAFWTVNDFHDRAYALGFTEASGNFQAANFSRGGAENDEIQIDTAEFATILPTFATPPDGQKPRLQLGVFTGQSTDAAFEPSMVYHETSHGLSNRLVGGGSTTCLQGVQSGGMGEGWGDFLAASFLNDPVIGAYYVNQPTVGIRLFSMASSPLSYDTIKNGQFSELTDVGEVWAAALWDLRNGPGGVGGLGAATTEQLVVSGMKLTPCNPTMLQARDAIVQADANLSGGANRCAIFGAFAHRLMGTGASSPTDNSTSTIVTSRAVPLECAGVDVTRNFTSTDVPKAIPDNTEFGALSAINVPAGLPDIVKVTVDINITHPNRGDLVVRVSSPGFAGFATLSNREGGTADNFTVTGLDISSGFAFPNSPSGQWNLTVDDLARKNTGTITSFALHITSSR